MRLFSLFIIAILTVACGKDGGSSSAPKDKLCNSNGQLVNCASIQGADGEGIDLLESIIDVPVQISGADVKVTSGKTSEAKGRRISCSSSVQTGEVIRYSQSGNSLTLMMGEGNFDMTRTAVGDGINGTWKWKQYIDQGALVIRTVTFLNNNRMIMRKTCEL